MSLKLVVDGSADPPGDRIDFVVRFEPQEKELEASAKGFSSPVVECRSPGQSVGNPQTESSLRKKLVRDGDQLVKRGSIVIPYRDWMLKKGTHRIAYEFSLQSTIRLFLYGQRH